MKSQARHLFDQSTFVERETSTGNVVRLKLEPVGSEQVRILEYHRKQVGAREFKRVKGEEGAVYPFASLGLAESFDELFGFQEAA